MTVRTAVTALYLGACVALVVMVTFWVAVLISGSWGLALVAAFPSDRKVF